MPQILGHLVHRKGTKWDKCRIGLLRRNPLIKVEIMNPALIWRNKTKWKI